MPSLLNSLEIKAVTNTNAGEMFRLKLRGKLALCVAIGDSHGRGRPVGILKHEDFDRPIFFEADLNHKCASYGTEWVIDTAYDENSYPVEYTSSERGVLYVNQGGALLRFHRFGNNDDFDGETVDLVTAKFAERTNNDIPVRSWKIWASEKDRVDPRAQPIVAFGS